MVIEIMTTICLVLGLGVVMLGYSLICDAPIWWHLIAGIIVLSLAILDGIICNVVAEVKSIRRLLLFLNIIFLMRRGDLYRNDDE